MCDTVVVVGDGRVLFAKNSDRDPNEAQVLEWHPGAAHESGARIRCTWIEVPQAAETCAILISRPFWMWGAEMGANAHGVTIGNEAVFTTEPYRASGLTGMDLLRLGLERSTTAAQALDVIRELLERHGQGGGCGHERRSFTYHSSFLIADPTEAYVLETAGQRHAAERVTAGVRSISNGLTIPGFAERHRDRLRGAVNRCATRRRITSAGAGPDTGTLIALLGSHGEGAGRAGPRYSALTGAMAAPCMHAGGVLATAQTTASWVSELRAGDSRHWATATAAPCTSLFKPVRVDAPVDLGPAPADRYEPATLWWRHERLHRRAMRDPATASFTAERDAVQRAWLLAPPPSPVAFAQADTLLARWTADTPSGRDTRPRWVQRYWRERDRRAGIPAGAEPPPLTPAPDRSVR